MVKKKITEFVSEELDIFLRNNGYELYNIEYVKEGRDWFLRVYIDWADNDGDRYIGTGDCEKVSGFLSGKLDEANLIESRYYLEVSSPGIDRALLKDRDYIKYSGKEVDVKLYKAENGNKTFSGILKGLNGDNIIIDVDGKELRFPKDQVAKTKLRVVFDKRRDKGKI